jgi:hypothetical protein
MPDTPAPVLTPENVMDQAQVFASAWSLVGGRFDAGCALDAANMAKADLRQMVTGFAAQAPSQQDRAVMQQALDALINARTAMEQYEVKIDREWGMGRTMEEIRFRGDEPAEIAQARAAIAALSATLKPQEPTP